MTVNILFGISLIIYLMSLIFILIITSNRKEKYLDTEINSEMEDIEIEDLKKLIDQNNFDEDIYNKNLNGVPIYFINLPKSKERKKFIKKQIQDYKIKNTKIIEAVYGKKKKPSTGKNMFQISMNTQKPIYFFNNDENATDGEIGCTLSHLNTVLKAYNDGLEHVIICEDDADLYWIKIWGDTINSIISNAPEDWEYISLVRVCNVDSKNNYLKYLENDCYCNTSQLWNRKGMKKILDKCYKNNKFILNKDWDKNVLADFYIPNLINSYAYKTSLFPPYNDHKHMDSTIHPDHTNIHIDLSISIIQNLYDDYDKQHIFREALEDMKQILDTNKIPFHLHSGTALGAIREQRFIPYDIDIDIAIFHKDRVSNLESIVTKNGKFELIDKLPGNVKKENEIMEFSFTHLNTRVKIDIFFIIEEKDKYKIFSYNGICDDKPKKRCEYINSKYKLNEKIFYNKKYKVPEEKFLEEQYGKDWKIPKNFSYSEGLTGGYKNMK